jgi:hypothetical protein
MDSLLAGLLADAPHLPALDPAAIPDGVSSLAVDYATPQFSESVPRLFARYLCARATSSHALEYTRFLLMFVLFRRIADSASRFADASWLALIHARVDAMAVAFELWQVALRFPSLEPPPPGDSPDGGIAAVIDSAHAAALPALAELQARAKRRLGFPPIFACGTPPADATTHPLPPELTPPRAIAFMPGAPEKMLLIGGDGHLAAFNGREAVVLDIPGVTGVIVHPAFPVFIALAADFPVLHHYDDGRIGPCSVAGSRPTCGAFSPTGAKFALCGDVVNIYSFDLTKEAYEPAIRRELRAPVTAVAWLNSDTMLAVAYAGNLVVVDTFSRYPVPVEMSPEWGAILAMTIEPKSGRVLSVTKRGYFVMMDLRASTPQLCAREWVAAPVGWAAIASAAGMVVLSFDRKVFLFHVADMETKSDVHVPGDVRGVSALAIIENRIAATAEPGRLLLWEPR